MSGDVEEEVSVLRSRVFRAVWAWIAQDHHERLLRHELLGLPQEGQGVVGDEVGEVVLGVVEAVPDLVPVDVDGVVVEPGVSNQGRPLVPAGGDPVAVVLVEVLSEVAWMREKKRDLFKTHRSKEREGAF